MRLRGGLRIVGAAVTACALVLFACSDDQQSGLDVDDGGTDAAFLPEAKENLDAGADVPDVRPNVDGAAEPVVCATTPCATQIAGGEGFFCAVLADGTVSCWGSDARGSLGTASLDAGADAAASPLGPVRIEGLSGVTQISARQGACARQGDGVVKCWGRNDYAQLGFVDPDAADAGAALNDDEAHPLPTEVVLGEPAVRVDVNDLYSCAVLASGKLACWGLNNLGLLAREGSTPYFGAPDLARLDAKSVRTTTGSSLSDDGAVWTWGVLLGRNTSIAPGEPSFSPMPIPSLTRVSDIAAESVTNVRRPVDGHACAIANGEVYCWGSANKYGALCTGIGNAEVAPAPVTLPLPQAVYPQQLAVTSTNTCVRATNGSVLCCGVDDLGQLGVGTVTDGGAAHVYQGKPFSPAFGLATAVDGYVVQIAMGAGAACALLRSGEVKCWGSNQLGQLGGGAADGAPHPTPVRVAFP